MQEFFENLGHTWPQYAMKAGGIVLTIVLASVLVRVVRRIIAASYDKRAQNLTVERQRKLETASTVMQSVSKYLIWFLAATAVVGQLGLTSTMNSMLAAAGVGGLAIGIGAQSFIKDVVAGLFFVFEDQAAVGDYVEAANVAGTVEEVSLRTLVIKGARGELHVIPHGQVAVMTNYSRTNYLAYLELDIAYEADADRAMELMREEAEAYAKTIEDAVEPPAVMGITALKASSITLRLVLRVKPTTQWAVERELRRRVLLRFKAEGIEVPYDKLVVHTREDAP